MTRLNRIAQDAPKSFGSVVLDRLGGWIALPIICLVGLAWNPGLRELGAPSRLAATVAVATLGVLALLFYLVSHGVYRTLAGAPPRHLTLHACAASRF